MLRVVLRVETGRPAKPREGRSWLVDRRPRPGAPTSSASGSYVWLLASRLFFLMGGAVLVNLIDHLPSRRHGLTRRQADGAFDRSCCSRSSSANLLAIVPGVAPLGSDRPQAGDLRRHARSVPSASAIVGAGARPSRSRSSARRSSAPRTGTFLAVDWALMTDIIPRASSGRYMGLSNVATASSTTSRSIDRRARSSTSSTGRSGSAPGRARRSCSGRSTTSSAALTLRPVVEPTARPRAARTPPDRRRSAPSTRSGAGDGRVARVDGAQPDAVPDAPRHVRSRRQPQLARASSRHHDTVGASRTAPAGARARDERPQEHEVVEPERPRARTRTAPGAGGSSAAASRG